MLREIRDPLERNERSAAGSSAELKVQVQLNPERVHLLIGARFGFVLVLKVGFEFRALPDRKHAASGQRGPAPFFVGAVMVAFNANIWRNMIFPDSEAPLDRQARPITPGIIAIDEAQVGSVS